MGITVKKKEWHSPACISVFFLIIVLMFFLPRPVFAESKLAWDSPESGTVDGYRIYYGLKSKIYDQNFDAGKVLECSLSDLSLKDNTTYYFTVRAYNPSGESTDSNEISWTSGDSTPALPPQNLAAELLDNNKIRISWALNSEPDVNGYNLLFGTASRQYGPAVPVGLENQYVLENLEEGKTYYFAATSIDTSNNESGFSKEVSLVIPAPPDQSTPPPDTALPNIAITFPVINGSYTTKNTTIKFEGTVSDDTGVEKVTWSNDLGGGGNAEGTENWVIQSIDLKSGENAITITAYDQAGKNASKTVTVISQTVPESDDEPPVIAFSAPTHGEKYTSPEPMTDISGTASDNAGVTKVIWKNRTTDKSGTASGTENWSVEGIELAEGRNVIRVIAFDGSGNKGAGRLIAVYKSDMVPPQLTFVSPTDGSRYVTSESAVSISGRASDNIGVTKVIWKNRTTDKSGTASGTENWSVQGIELAEGRNVIRVIAFDGSGNKGAGRLIAVYKSDMVPPQLTFVSPTDGSRYVTSESAVSISGRASDNIGVTKVIWKNNTTDKSGTASGTENWTAQGIELAEGRNVIRVIAFDAMNNRDRGRIVVVYKPDTAQPIN
jgi:hypothetical protein